MHLQRNATQRIPELYLLTNNYFKFLFQKIFFVLRVCGVNLVKSFLTLIKFNFDNLSKKNINLAIKNLKEINENKGFIYA